MEVFESLELNTNQYRRECISEVLILLQDCSGFIGTKVVKAFIYKYAIQFAFPAPYRY